MFRSQSNSRASVPRKDSARLERVDSYNRASVEVLLFLLHNDSRDGVFSVSLACPSPVLARTPKGQSAVRWMLFPTSNFGVQGACFGNPLPHPLSSLHCSPSFAESGRNAKRLGQGLPPLHPEVAFPNEERRVSCEQMQKTHTRFGTIDLTPQGQIRPPNQH